MAWSTSDRRSRLPANWRELRKKVLERDGYQCTAIKSNGKRCPNKENLEVDHHRAGDDHSENNLRTLCYFHHKAKSSREGGEAKAKKLEENKKRWRRPPETHPSLIPPWG